LLTLLYGDIDKLNRLLLDIPEVIETPRLTLQMPKAGYGAAVHAALTDGYEDYIKWLAWPETVPSVEAVEEDCRKHHAECILRDFIRYLIIEKSTGSVVGRCGFPPFQANWLIPQFGLSYLIRKSERSKGYATEASHALTVLAFKVLKARKVEIHFDSENIASGKIPQNLNFKLEYTQRGGWPRPDGELAQVHTYSCFSLENLPDLKVNW
jgi:RimJ/RimL family protein N-acetyltransferase